MLYPNKFQYDHHKIRNKSYKKPIKSLSQKNSYEIPIEWVRSIKKHYEITITLW